VALAFVRHCDITAVADVACISLNTAKTHFKKIFTKTGCRKQAELMKLLCTLGEREGGE